MRILVYILILALALSQGGVVWCSDVSSDDDTEQSSGGNPALTGALLGGLLGGGLGAAIGSASGHAGTGALIGAGVGAVGGTVVGANQASKQSQKSTYQEEAPKKGQSIPKGATIKKKVIRQYDEEGNLISEEEVKN